MMQLNDGERIPAISPRSCIKLLIIEKVFRLRCNILLDGWKYVVAVKAIYHHYNVLPRKLNFSYEDVF